MTSATTLPRCGWVGMVVVGGCVGGWRHPTTALGGRVLGSPLRAQPLHRRLPPRPGGGARGGGPAEDAAGAPQGLHPRLPAAPPADPRGLSAHRAASAHRRYHGHLQLRAHGWVARGGVRGPAGALPARPQVPREAGACRLALAAWSALAPAARTAAPLLPNSSPGSHGLPPAACPRAYALPPPNPVPGRCRCRAQARRRACRRRLGRPATARAARAPATTLATSSTTSRCWTR